MSLATPEQIRKLQQGLYLKAKTEPNFRFYSLYDKVYRTDVLYHAYRLVRANHGAPGVDGVSIEKIEAEGVDEWLVGLQTELRTRQYRPKPVRRVMIPKPGGGERPLGIPTLRDRVAQMAAKMVLEPIFEADFEPNAYGYRPGRSAGDAIKRVHALLIQGYTDVVDADLSKYLDCSSDYPPFPGMAAKRSGEASGALILKPFRRPWQIWTACSSPRFTRCKMVWRETPRRLVASIMGMKPGGVFSTKRARSSSVMWICQGAPGVGCSAGMKPSSIQRSKVDGVRPSRSAALRTVTVSPSRGSVGAFGRAMPR